MEPLDAASGAAGTTRSARSPRRTRIVVIAVTLVVGLAASLVAWTLAENNAASRQRSVARNIRESVRSTAENAVAGLGGAAALVDDRGDVSPTSFAVFQRDVAAESSLGTLALVNVVPAGGRAGFETATGRPITDRTDLTFHPATARDGYWPVRQISPADTPGVATLVGFDIAADPVTERPAAIARDTGRTTITEPVAIPGMDPVLFILKPLYRPGAPTGTVQERRAAHAGFVASAYSGRQLAATVTPELDDAVRFSVRDGSTTLSSTSPAPRGGVSRSVRIGGRELGVRVEDSRPTNHDLTWFLLGITGVIVGALVILTRRSTRYEQDLARTNTLVGRTADLAQRLAAASTADEVAGIITHHGRLTVGATAASIGLRDDEAGVLRVHHGDTVTGAMQERFASPPLDARLVLTDAARTGEVLLLPDFESYQRSYPDTGPENVQLGQGARAGLPLRDDHGVIGSIVFAWDAPRHFDDVLVSSLSTIAQIAGQTVARARLAEAQAVDARHSRELAHLAQGLAARSHTDDITDFVTESVLDPLDATHAAVGLIEGGVLRRHFSPGLVEASRPELTTGLRATPLEALTPLTDAVRTGTPVFLASPAELRASYPEFAALWADAGFRATAALAVHDRTGQVVGGLGIAWDHPVVFREELRDRLTTIVGMVGQSLERGRLADELRDTAVRNEQLADFAQRLAPVRTIDGLCSAVTEQAGLPVGAVAANIGIVDPVHRVLDVRPHPHVAPDQAQAFGERSLDDRLPGTDAVRTRRPVLLGSVDEAVERYPGRVADTAKVLGLESSAHLPLIGPDGSVLGVLGFAWDAAQRFDTTTSATLRTLAELCGQTLERVRLAEAEHRLVTSLQERVVTPLPGAHGLTIAQRYLPAAQQIGMGGDWYEGIVLDDHRYALVVGDTAGHGISAVADMIQLRSIIGSLLRSIAPLEEIFPLVASLLHRDDGDVTATACAAVVDTRAGTIRYVSAGHLPAVLRSPDGTTRLLEDGRQPLLGVPSRVVTAGTAPFPPGSVLITYTDGIVERRREPIDDSIGRLVRAAEATNAGDLEAMADDLIDRCLQGQDPEDDVALVLIARD